MSTLAKASLWLLVPILLFGVFVGGLMTWHHDVQLFGDAQIELVGCTESAEVNCDIVNTSAYSELLGVPIATLAIPFYGLALFLVAQALRGREGRLPAGLPGARRGRCTVELPDAWAARARHWVLPRLHR